MRYKRFALLIFCAFIYGGTQLLAYNATQPSVSLKHVKNTGMTTIAHNTAFQSSIMPFIQGQATEMNHDLKLNLSQWVGKNMAMPTTIFPSGATHCMFMDEPTRCSDKVLPTVCLEDGVAFTSPTACPPGVGLFWLGLQFHSTHCENGQTIPTLCPNDERIPTRCPRYGALPTFCHGKSRAPTTCVANPENGEPIILPTVCVVEDKMAPTKCTEDRGITIPTICFRGSHFETHCPDNPRECHE